MSDVLIIGDSCIDICAYCNCRRLAPDAPIPILDMKYCEETPGMAKNVERNIQELGTNCDILTNNNWESALKTRYIDIDSNYMFVRVDDSPPIPQIDLSSIDYNYDIIVISDYDKGFLSTEDINTICKNHSCVFLDTKKPLSNWAEDATFIKINNKEYENPLNKISNKLRNKLIRTAGPRGSFYQEKQFPVREVDIKDVSGAGDTFLAGLVVKYLQTNTIESSIKWGNECSTIAVQKRGISTV